MSAAKRDVFVNEVGLRDGLQIIKPIMSTEDKKGWCTRAANAGFPEIEVTSLVPSRLIPQFFDAADVIAHAKTLPGLVASALTPNLKGAERGVEFGVGKLTYIISVSESFNRANVRRSKQESIDDLHRIVALRDSLPEGQRPIVVGGISSAFGCTIEGRISPREIALMAETMLEAGVDELALADTTGSGDPAWVDAILRPVIGIASHVPIGVHFHDTRGTGLANVVVALECGIRRFDASLGGLGGCPNSPGATGNIATEDLVYMLEAMGLDTGIDIDALIALRRDIAALLPNVPFYGHIATSGLPTGFREFRSDALAARKQWTN